MRKIGRIFNSLNDSYHFTASHFNDNQFYLYAEEFLDYLKVNSKLDDASLNHALLASLKIIPFIFHKQNLNTLTRETLHSILNENGSSMRRIDCRYLVLFIYYLIENHTGLDISLQEISHLKDKFIKNTNFEDFMMVLVEPNPSKYQYLTLNSGTNVTFHLNAESSLLRDVLADFLIDFNRSRLPALNFFLDTFEASLGDCNISNLTDFNYDTFMEQVNYYKKSESLSILISFYLFIYRKYNNLLFFNSSNVNPVILQRTDISEKLKNDYELIHYNPLESIPSSDKWLLMYVPNSESNSSTTTTSSTSIDFSRIVNPTYRDWVKSYIWLNDATLYTKQHSMANLVKFLNYIWGIKTGEILTIHTKKTVDLHITLSEIIAFKNYILSSYDNKVTRSRYIYSSRALMNHVYAHNLDKEETAIFYHLKYNSSEERNTIKTIPHEHLELLSTFMKNESSESFMAQLYYAIFFLALNTEFRSSQILSLDYDCVREASKNNEYVILSKTKTSNNEKVEQAITIFVKRQIDEIIKITEPFRSECTDRALASKLFLIPGNRTGAYSILNAGAFNNYISSICKKLGIPKYTLANLRDTHMTMAEEYIIRNALSDLDFKTLSGHKSTNTTTKHYVDTDLMSMLESVHGVVVGNIDLQGNILKSLDDTINQDENQVSNGCGYCSKSICNNFLFLDCYMCKDFVTTIDRIPYYKEQIRIIDNKLSYVTIPHDKEDLVNIKRLLLAYMGALLSLEKRESVNDYTNSK